MNGRVEGRVSGRVGGCVEGCVEGRVEGRAEGCVGMHRQILSVIQFSPSASPLLIVFFKFCLRLYESLSVNALVTTCTCTWRSFLIRE